MMMMMMALFIYFSSKEDKTLKKRARKALFSFACLFFSFFIHSLADDLSLVFQFFSFSLSPSPPHHPIVTLLFITLYEKRD
jgi:hypothetical protein